MMKAWESFWSHFVDTLFTISIWTDRPEHKVQGVVGWDKGIVYLTSIVVSNWYWLTVGQGLLSLQQVRVEGECFYFFCFFTFIHLSSFPVPLFHLLYYLFYLSSSGGQYKMTHKGWHVVIPQHKQTNKKCRPRSDTTFCGIWSWSTLFAINSSVSF